MLAELTEGLRALEAAGMDAAEALSKITMTISADVDFFATLAKIRAARVLFANIAEAVGAPDTPPQIHAETSLRGPRYAPRVKGAKPGRPAWSVAVWLLASV